MTIKRFDLAPRKYVQAHGLNKEEWSALVEFLSTKAKPALTLSEASSTPKQEVEVESVQRDSYPHKGLAVYKNPLTNNFECVTLSYDIEDDKAVIDGTRDIGKTTAEAGLKMQVEFKKLMVEALFQEKR